MATLLLSIYITLALGYVLYYTLHEIEDPVTGSQIVTGLLFAVTWPIWGSARLWEWAFLDK